MAMSFPKIGNKHRFTPLFSAKQIANDWPKLPANVLLIFSRSFEARLKKDLKLKRFETKVSDRAYLTRDRKMAVLLLTIGAPMTAVVVEESIVCGARNFLILGTAGGLSGELSISDIVLCNRAVRDEGTSHHYLKNSKYIAPDLVLTSALAKAMRRWRIKYNPGTTWSIDALYAETREEVAHYRKEGVLTVEMEASALFAVAKKRRARAAAVFTVSDTLGEEWSGFVKQDYKKIGYERLSRIASLYKNLNLL